MGWGYPLSPLFFALGVSAASASIGEQPRRLDSKYYAFAYLDNVVFVVAPGRAEVAHCVVQDALMSHGLVLNVIKPCVLLRDPWAPLPEFLQGL